MKLDELKFQYSKDNHYRWGWGTDDTEWFNEPDYTQPFKLTFGRCSRTPLSFREECILATEHLVGQVDRPVYVGLSGGLDSQVVCTTLMLLGVNFTPCIIVMDGNENLHDVLNAKLFCEKHGLKYRLFKIDMYEFYSKFCPSIVERYKITNARTIMQLWLEQYTRDGIFIMGGGDLQLTRYKTGEAQYDYVYGAAKPAPMTPCTWSNRPTPILQHLIAQGTYGTTKYFMYTPEMMASVVLSPEVEAFVGIQDAIFSTALIQRKNFWKLFNFIPKTQLYRRNFPELILNPKYHGFEVVEKNNQYKRLKRQTVAEYAVLNNEKGVFLTYEELVDYFSNSGEQKIWYSNPIVKEDNSIEAYLRTLSLREDNTEDGDPLDAYDFGGIDI